MNEKILQILCCLFSEGGVSVKWISCLLANNKAINKSLMPLRRVHYKIAIIRLSWHNQASLQNNLPMMHDNLCQLSPVQFVSGWCKNRSHGVFFAVWRTAPPTPCRTDYSFELLYERWRSRVFKGKLSYDLFQHLTVKSFTVWRWNRCSLLGRAAGWCVPLLRLARPRKVTFKTYVKYPQSPAVKRRHYVNIHGNNWLTGSFWRFLLCSGY